MDSFSNEQFAERVGTHLPEGSDEVLVVLKAHLLVEEELGSFLAVYADASSLARAKLTFNQKLWVLKAISQIQLNQNCLDAIDLLNQIRNKFAHSIEPENVDNLQRDLVNAMQKYLDEEIPDLKLIDQTPAQVFRHYLAFLIFYLGSARKVAGRESSGAA